LYKVGLAFIFVVTTCERIYLVPDDKAIELKLVGEGALLDLHLPHPDECTPEHPYYACLLPPRP
jgi:hypothetical protein